MADQPTIDVLLVDFFDSARSSTCEILSLSGFSVVEADDGEIAHELLRERRFGLLLLDVDLPKRNGLELLESVPDAPPVVLYTACPIEPHERERLRDKIVSYLVKPVEPTVLIERVTDVLKDRRQAA